MSDLPTHLQKPRLRRWEATEYLERTHGLTYAEGTLAKLASIGGGPKFNKSGRAVLYPVVELDTWAESKIGALVSNTTEADSQRGK